MHTSIPDSLKDMQVQQIDEYRAQLQNMFKRNVTIIEAFIHWLALADAEDSINNHYFE